MAELRHWHGVCLTMSMFKRIGRLFTIKTRFEAFLVTYAIAVGAVVNRGWPPEIARRIARTFTPTAG